MTTPFWLDTHGQRVPTRPWRLLVPIYEGRVANYAATKPRKTPARSFSCGMPA